jgi:hypothetical protein
MHNKKIENTYQNTLNDIFEYPISKKLKWHKILILMEHLGDVKTKNNGQVTFTVNGMPRIFHPDKDQDTVDTSEVQEIQEFLESVGIGHNSVIDATPHRRLLVVITRQETRIFRSLEQPEKGEKGATAEHLRPDDPHHILHRLNHTDGGNKTAHALENVTYYHEIAERLVGAEEVLLMGHGTGAGNAMNHLRDFVTTHYPDIADNIVGSLTLDVEAMTNGQLLHEARQFFLRQEGK